MAPGLQFLPTNSEYYQKSLQLNLNNQPIQNIHTFISLRSKTFQIRHSAQKYLDLNSGLHDPCFKD